MESVEIKILISTIGNRIENVEKILLLPRSDVEYIVCWQTDRQDQHNMLFGERNDVKVYPIYGHGLCANRNHALSIAADTPLNDNSLWILADDDVRLNAKWLDSLKALAITNKETDLFILQALTYDGMPLHYYPAVPFRYPYVPRGFYFNTMGMVLRSHRPWPRFDTRFGLGAPVLKMGEEDIFIRDCNNRGLTINYFPQPLLMTAATTTSSAYNSDPSLQMSKGAVLTLLHGRLMALPRIFYTVIKMRNNISPLPHLRNMLRGMEYISSQKEA